MATIGHRESERLQLAQGARTLHEACVVVDLHVDCVIQQRLFGYDIREEHDPNARAHWGELRFAAPRALMRRRGAHQPLYNHADIPRMIRGGYSAAILSLHAWPGQSEQRWREINRQLDYIDRVLADDPRVMRALHPDDLSAAHAQGKLALLCSVEGLHCLGAGGRKTEARRLDRIEQLFARGVRYITFAHFSRNDAASHAYGPGSRRDDGLGPFARQVIRKMNELGMLIDVAHVNRPGVREICAATRHPVIASHTGFEGAIGDGNRRFAERLLDNDGLRAIADTGGTTGVMLAPDLLGEPRGGLGCVVDHLHYGLEELDRTGHSGARHLSIGSDFDGWIPAIPTEMQDAADIPLLTAAMLEAGIAEDAIRGIWGENFLRVWRQVAS